ncbi:MAG: hypothetical protein QUU85_13570, partial [Candidatus Eisenbacteria bacterium]|nr:hypothetical protein [Candidatus Eisenbacteria bacterium]
MKESLRFPSLLLGALALLPPAAFAVTDYSFDWRLPTPQGEELKAVTFEDAQTGYAVGLGGSVAVSYTHLRAHETALCI